MTDLSRPTPTPTPTATPTTLDAAQAARFARLTLGHLGREWPFHPGWTLTGPSDLAAPREVHPIFHGSFDWHSCVHGWWQVLTLLRLHPAMPPAGEIAARADAAFTPAKVAGEVAFLDRPCAAGFERPYGWAWLLALHLEMTRHRAYGWAQATAPLATLIARRLAAYLPRLLYPIRSGKHDNSAFALTLARRWALVHDAALAAAIDRAALAWFADDADARPWEPGGEDFLSPTLCEAMLMRDVLDGGAFRDWLGRFLPDPFGPAAACLRTPATVTDRQDGRLAHLDGLNLSRAWCWRGLAEALSDPAEARAIGERHLAAALPHLADDYMGEHWLATFALLALNEDR